MKIAIDKFKEVISNDNIITYLNSSPVSCMFDDAADELNFYTTVDGEEFVETVKISENQEVEFRGNELTFKHSDVIDGYSTCVTLVFFREVPFMFSVSV